MAKRFKKLFLHIGLEKTGTTSIQSLLEKNRNALKSADFFLPTTLGNLNHKLLCAYALNYGSNDVAISALGLGSERSRIDAFRQSVEQSFLAEIGNSDETVCIISTEDLSRLFTREEVQRVIGLLSKITETITVIVFLRRQDLLAASRYYSFVLGGSSANSIFPLPHRHPDFYNYRQNLALWSDEIGKDNITIAVFPEKPKEAKFDSKRAFCDLVGLSQIELEADTDKHISLDAINQIILQNFNAVLGTEHDARLRLGSILKEYNTPQHQFVAGENEAREFYERYRHDNEKLFAEFAVEGCGFSDDFSMYSRHNMRQRFQRIAIQRLLMILKEDMDRLQFVSAN